VSLLATAKPRANAGLSPTAGLPISFSGIATANAISLAVRARALVDDAIHAAMRR
jgi:hypothetical protein